MTRLRLLSLGSSLVVASVSSLAVPAIALAQPTLRVPLDPVPRGESDVDPLAPPTPTASQQGLPRGATSNSLVGPPRYDAATPVGKLLVPRAPRQPVTNLTEAADENRVDWSPSTPYYSRYAAPSQVETTGKTARILDWKFGH